MPIVRRRSQSGNFTNDFEVNLNFNSLPFPPPGELLLLSPCDR